MLTWWSTPETYCGRPGRAQLSRGVQRKKSAAMMRPADAPAGHDREVSPLEPDPGRIRVEGVEERLEEMPEREQVREVQHPVGDLALGMKIPGDEVERQRDRVGDGRGGLLAGDDHGHREAEAGERRRAHDQRHEDRGQRLVRDRDAVDNPAEKVTTTSIRSEITSALPTRPAMNTQLGSGVPVPA